jgi:allantoinase
MPKNSDVFALRSRRVLADGVVAPRTVVIEDGMIAGLLPYDGVPPGARVEDLGNLVLMAGLTDVHVHVNEPGRTDWEGFATATRAAAAGGVTTLIDMPLNSTPVTTTAGAFEAKLAAAEGQLTVDVGYWGGVVPQDLDELPGLLASGVLGLKAFLVHSGIEDFPNVTAADLERALPLLAPTGMPLLVHCELDVSGRPTPEDPDPRSYRQYLDSRPGRWELDAIGLVLDLCRRFKTRVHIVHLSCADALPLLRQAKAEGLPVTVETCPHYLVLDAESIPDGDTRFKCAPPIRERANRDRLWEGLADGTIDFIATDHSPCPPALKRLDTGDFARAWGGIASIQFLLPLVWTEASRRGLTLADVERWVCTRPASFAGLGAVKGRIAPGYRADLVAWDPEAGFEITPEKLVYRHRITPYSGRSWRGLVAATWLAGQSVWSAGAPVGQPSGRSLLRTTPRMDGLSEAEARTVLHKACASDAWVSAMLARRPFGDYRALSGAAGEVWDALAQADKRQAYAAHPRIGEKYKNNREQAGVTGASAATLNRLARANQDYETRFGFGFLVFATGKTAEQMADLLEARLGRSAEEEEAEASLQHHKITLFRLAQGEFHAV